MGAFLALALIILRMLQLGRFLFSHCRSTVAFSGFVRLQIILNGARLALSLTPNLSALTMHTHAEFQRPATNSGRENPS